MGNWVDLLREELQRQRKSDHTVSGYSKDVEQFLVWFTGTYDKTFEGTLIDFDVSMYKSYLRNIQRVSAATTNRKLNALLAFSKVLVAGGFSKKIIEVEYVNMELTVSEGPEVLSRNELNRLRRSFQAADKARDIAIFEILYNTGIRVSELISLEPADFTITIKNGENNFSLLKVREGKGNKYREIPLNRTSVNAINKYKECRPASVSNFFFVGQRGHLTRSSINKILIKYCKDADIKEIGPHVLRHTFATDLIEKGTDLVTVSRLLGHADAKLTEKIYVKSRLENKKSAVDRLEDDF